MFSNDHRVSSQCNTRLRLLYLLTKTELYENAPNFKLEEFERVDGKRFENGAFRKRWGSAEALVLKIRAQSLNGWITLFSIY